MASIERFHVITKYILAQLMIKEGLFLLLILGEHDGLTQVLLSNIRGRIAFLSLSLLQLDVEESVWIGSLRCRLDLCHWIDSITENVDRITTA